MPTQKSDQGIIKQAQATQGYKEIPEEHKMKAIKNAAKIANRKA
jgi:hypothetical protein